MIITGLQVVIRSQREIELMRTAGKLAAETLMLVGEKIRPGITGKDIERIVKENTEKQDGFCAPFQYTANGTKPPFPAHCCVSPSNVVCHGIPNNKPLDNMIFNVDITTISKDGAHGDTSAMFFIGKVPHEASKLAWATNEALQLAISKVKANVRLGDIGSAIQKYIESYGYSVVEDYTGHGIGIGPGEFHMPPSIPHYGTEGLGRRMPSGSIFTIEPMVNLGKFETELDEDQWTARTVDGSLSAQWEHTILVLEDRAEILTERPGALKNSF